MSRTRLLGLTVLSSLILSAAPAHAGLLPGLPDLPALPDLGIGELIGETGCSLLGETPIEDGLVDSINAFRTGNNRLPVDADIVLGTVADAVALIASNEGDLMKVRAQTRDFLLSDAVSVRALIMKGKNMNDVWRRMTKNTYPRSILLRKGAENVGTGIVDTGSHVYVVTVMGGSLITPLGC